MWSLEHLWRTLASLVVEALAPPGQLELAIDDTIFQKQGRKVEGAARYRDPVRSLVGVASFVTGVNFIGLALLIHPPWGGMPLALPLGVRLYRKQGPIHLELAAAMVSEVAAWFPRAPLPSRRRRGLRCSRPSRTAADRPRLRDPKEQRTPSSLSLWWHPGCPASVVGLECAANACPGRARWLSRRIYPDVAVSSGLGAT